MKTKLFLFLAGVATLITTTGCFFPGRGGGHWHDRGEVIVAPSAVAVQTPEVLIGPPLVVESAPEVVVR